LILDPGSGSLAPDFGFDSDQSLLSASLVTAEMVTVYQDGSHSGVSEEARVAGVVLERHERTQGREGAQHIAAHYGWALKRYDSTLCQAGSIAFFSGYVWVYKSLNYRI
jgi:hypothetical protein